VTAVSHASSLSIKRKGKRKSKEKKRNIKSRKIDKRKRKMLLLNCIITITMLIYWCLANKYHPLQ